MRALPVLALGLISLAQSASAAEAAFSSDGKTLFALSREGDKLLAFEAGNATPKQIPLPKPFGDDASQLLTDPQGLLVTAGGKLWQWNPADAKAAPKALAPLPGSFQVFGLSRAEGEGVAGTLLISGWYALDSAKPKPKDVDENASLFGLKPGAKAFKPVFVRRLERITACPVFSNGRMVFGGDHDLWEGGLEAEEDVDFRSGTLWGHRSAPLGMLNTDGANGGGMGVREVVIAGDTVWAALGGRHMGSLVSVPLEKKPPEAEHPDLVEAWKIQREQLSQTKAVLLPIDGEDKPSDTIEAVDGLCVWNGPDGTWKIAFRADHKVFWQIEKGAKEPKKLGEETRPE
ncbi:hypothetical protein [Luteolibacter sp. LG18]|uniref:hypothetical protein n=1 Tax=Luteolibacter sp. LG18 TaxID=2819286 RepID=UPI002B2F9858|nr:hypothetical protein llg_08450 [Luteolibacter sp. LG18]